MTVHGARAWALAEPARDGKGLTLREVLHADTAREASESTLVEALLTARILIARTDADGRPTVRLAHDAVLASWPRANEAAQASREFYRVRAEVEDGLRRWQEHSRPKDRLIQPGVSLAEAERLVRDFSAEISSELIEYVTASRNRARRRQRFERAAAVFFFGLATAAIAASLFAWWERGRTQQALQTITQTGTTLQYDLTTEFRNRGLPSDLLGRMLGRVIQGYDQVIRLDPKNAVVYVSRGNAYNTMGDLQRALADFSAAVRLDPKNAIVYATRGAAYKIIGNIDHAIKDYDLAIELDPKNVFVYRARADAYNSKGDRDRAIQDYDRVIALDPNDALTYASRGIVYTTKNAPDRAIRDFDAALERDPKSAHAYSARGLAYAMKDDYEAALKDLDKAIQLDSTNALVFQNRGFVYAKKTDYDRAIHDYGQAIQLDPKNALSYFGRGDAYEGKRDHDRAIYYGYDQAIELDPNNALFYIHRGDALQAKGDYDRATQDYSQAIQLDRTNADAYVGSGGAYEGKGDYDRALRAYDQALKFNSVNADAHSGRGRAYFYQGNFKLAAAAFSRAHQSSNDGYSVIWLYLARERDGENAKAELEANAAGVKRKEWPYPVVELFLGARSPAQLLSLAGTPEERCEAEFYSGEWLLLQGDPAAATANLQTAAEACPKDFLEYKAALPELKRLK